MLPEEFERIAAAAEREGVRLEFLDGSWGSRPRRLYPERGLKVESYRTGHAKPDGALAPEGSFAGAGEWADTRQVLMVLEVSSYDRDTDHRDRVEKPRA